MRSCSRRTLTWFNGKPRAELFKEAIRRGLEKPTSRHGATRRIFINNLFFGGKLPRFLGFDYEFEHIGSRATIPQSQLYRSAGRDNSFAATFRMVCDFRRDRSAYQHDLAAHRGTASRLTISRA